MTPEIAGGGRRSATRRRHVVMLLVLLAVTAGLRLYRLDVPEGYYFDEVYHGFTAKQYLAGDRSAYDPWAESPPGVNYEWTHPPLGRVFMAGTMAAFGQDQFGMRLSSAAMGTLAVALVFLVTVRLFSSARAGLLAGFLYSVEGLSFVHSRIAIPDLHFVVYVLASLLCYIEWRTGDGKSPVWLLAAGFAAGCALATKWTALYLFALLGVDCLIFLAFHRPRRWVRTPLLALAGLIVLPAAVYLVSYAQYFRMGYSWGDFLTLQREMWRYHTGLTDTHMYQSAPWQWVLNLRPVWLYVHGGLDEPVANIYDLGNSVVLYFGLAAMAVLAVRMVRGLTRAGGMAFLSARVVRGPTWAAAFLPAAYLILWVPWSFSPRIMFFYHYLPAVPMLCVAAGLLLDRWLAHRWKWVRVVGWAVPILAAAWFAFFYPHMTAVSVSRAWSDAAYYWLPSWR